MTTEEFTDVESGAAWLDLVITLGAAYGPAPVERLRDPARLAEWLAREDLRPLTRPNDQDVADAVALREALRTLALAVVRGDRPPPSAVTRLNAALARDHPLRVRGTSGAGLTRNRPATTTEALARLARQAADTLTGPDAAALRQCGDEVCGMLFLDPTGRRRWCSVEVCGSRNRVRALRARRRASDPETA